jgi:hypothetical protein
MRIRLALAAIGIVIWGYAVAVDHANLRLVGIVLLAASLILRFAGPRRPGGTTPEP